MKNSQEKPKEVVILKKVKKNDKTRRFTAKTKSVSETPLNLEKKFPSISTNDVEQNAMAISKNNPEDASKKRVKKQANKRKRTAVKVKKNSVSPKKRIKISEGGEEAEKQTSNSKAANKKEKIPAVISPQKPRIAKGARKKAQSRARATSPLLAVDNNISNNKETGRNTRKEKGRKKASKNPYYNVVDTLPMEISSKIDWNKNKLEEMFK